MRLTKKQIAERLEKAKSLSFTKKKRWSAARSLVLETLLKQNTPHSAYELMEQISKNSNQTILSASIFRILESFCSLGIAFRIDRTKSFVANKNIGDASSFLFVCEMCGNTIVGHNQKLKDLLDQTMLQNDFTMRDHIITINGKCMSCGQKNVRHQ